MIELINLSKTYTNSQGTWQALENINLQVPAGKIFGVIGKSGAGKSTLIRCVNLLERPTSGQVIVAQQNLLKLSPTELRQARHHIGMIFQHFNLLALRTVYDNIALPLHLTGHNAQQIRAIITPLLELTGLSDKSQHYPQQLSGGQKQRVAIARALAAQPKLLLCDEATSALDPNTTTSILDLLNKINRELGLTILLITHEMDVIKYLCHEVALLDQGRLIEHNTVQEFFKAPRSSLAQDIVSTALRQQLPAALAAQISTASNATHRYPLLRIIFQEQTATEPLITRLIQRFGLTVNILQASIEYLQDSAIGIMVLAVTENSQQLPAAVTYLQQQGVNTEMIGYVS